MINKEYEESLRYHFEDGHTFIFCSETLAKFGKDLIRELKNRIQWNWITMKVIKETYGEQFYNEIFKGTDEEESVLFNERLMNERS